MVVTTKEDFAQRLHKACDHASPPIPQGRGRRAELVRRVFNVGMVVSGEAVRKWLSGESIPAMDSVRHIARALSVDTDWLLTGRKNGALLGALAKEPETSVYELLPQAIRDVVEIMRDLDSSYQAKVLFAAQLAKHEQSQERSRNSSARVG